MIFFYINWLVLSVSIYLSKILLLHGILSSEFRNVIQLSYLSYVGIQKRYFRNYKFIFYFRYIQTERSMINNKHREFFVKTFKYNQQYLLFFFLLQRIVEEVRSNYLKKEKKKKKHKNPIHVHGGKKFQKKKGKEIFSLARATLG